MSWRISISKKMLYMTKSKDIIFPEFNDIFEDTKTPRNGRAPLTKKVAEFMLGESLDNVVMYDIVNDRKNKRYYNGHYVVGGNFLRDDVPQFKKLCEQSSVLAGREPVALVAKTCLYRFGVAYNLHGWDVVGNVIFYEPKTKTYSAFTQGWMLCGKHKCNMAASEQALYDVVTRVARDIKTVESFCYKKTK